MSRSFVTGATGHLGANLVRVLLQRGDAVRVLVRRAGDPAIAGLPVEVSVGDLGDTDALARALDGCDRLYHLAGLVSIHDGDRSALHATNVVGTRRILSAARRAGVERVVHCSSFGAVGRVPDGCSDERTRLHPQEPALDYDRTKAAAEAEVQRAVAAGLDVRIVCPSGLLGPWDFKPSLVGRTILDFARGRISAYVPGGHDFVPVGDAALGHVLAMERGRAGERYLLTGETTTLDALFEWMAKDLGRDPPRLRIPARVVLPIAVLKDRIERTFLPRARSRFSAQTIRLLSERKIADASWTRARLGFAPGRVCDAVAEHIAWFRLRGLL